MQATIQITDCRDCPFAQNHSGQGECWTHCIHPEHGQGPYGNIIWGCAEKFKETPKWCPINKVPTSGPQIPISLEMRYRRLYWNPARNILLTQMLDRLIKK